MGAMYQGFRPICRRKRILGQTICTQSSPTCSKTMVPDQQASRRVRLAKSHPMQQVDPLAHAEKARPHLATQNESTAEGHFKGIARRKSICISAD